MDSPIPADPYEALGVLKDADASVIKSVYRKLALKCHPDKVTDDTLKAQKTEEFHKIQQAYDILSDDEKRARYDAQVRLAELRREAMERRGGASTEARRSGTSGNYEVRTQAPAGANYSTPRSSARDYRDEKRPTRPYEEDRYYEESRTTSRKYDGYESKRSSPKVPRDRSPNIRVHVRDSDRSRSEKKKTKDREEKKDRQTKYAYVEEDLDRDRYERRRESDDERLRRETEDARRRQEYARALPRREEEYVDDRARKYSSHLDTAQEYIQKSSRKGSLEPENVRPSSTRRSSSREARDAAYAYDYPHRISERPAQVRRSSARPKERSTREPQIVEDRRPPTLQTSTSSPANIKVTARPTTSRPLERAHTTLSDVDHGKEHPSHPAFRRTETMPTLHTTSTPQSSRRRDAPTSSSRLRNETNIHDSGYSSPGTPDVQYTQPKATYYRYGSGETGGVSVIPEDKYNLGGGRHRTVLREPESRRHRSPSPLTRGPERPSFSTANVPHVRYTEPTPSAARPTAYAYPAERPSVSRTSSARSPERPSISRTNTARSPDRRGRERPLFREIPKTAKDEEMLRAQQRTRYDPPEVSWSPAYDKANVSYSRRGRDTLDREGRPSLQRGATFVY